MCLPWSSLAVAAAVATCSIFSGGLTFQIQAGNGRAPAGASSLHSQISKPPFPSASGSLMSMSTFQPTPYRSSQTGLLSAVAAPLEGGSASCGDSRTATDATVLAMAAFLRCHKPLLNDRGSELPDGNLCMLLRGCDAHQRMISPLELKTNAEALPGAAAAGLMAAKGSAAAEALCEQLKEKIRAPGAPEGAPHGVCAVELLKLEVEKVHRLLQYATAAGLKKNFLSRDALVVMRELYEELGLDSDLIVKVLQGLKEFYKAEMDKASFQDFFLPAFEEVIAKFDETKQLVRHAEKIPFESLPFEPTPDPRTLTPLVVDIMSFKDKLPNLKQWEGKQ
ncbi:uncharacterized protein LOC34623529 [Cyclospora cayetanensis]|uniref:Uncharacterized protein LOC34623529 n=1 Tax=Cyclospora cayetanensis TaxID=88456 RepID=A0A6P6RU34_9EIME|nr:uncharacterized protein LOC34623529 [Cyclospora cayetanensis]